MLVAIEIVWAADVEICAQTHETNVIHTETQMQIYCTNARTRWIANTLATHEQHTSNTAQMHVRDGLQTPKNKHMTDVGV